ncbi:hypothetical protein [Nocardia sp. CA-145437]|uniref:hypothetical protein n=1 Tax=Nocardia sp. CA-145437 TaxID=3239980 RepID=UPI003D9762A0
MPGMMGTPTDPSLPPTALATLRPTTTTPAPSTTVPATTTPADTEPTDVAICLDPETDVRVDDGPGRGS